MNLSPGNGDLGRPWVVFSDIALAVLFVFMLFIFAQFVYYEKVLIHERLEARQDTVHDMLLGGLPASFKQGLRVVAAEGFSQRIAFSSNVLFGTCRDTPRTSGEQLVSEVGRILYQKQHYFEAIQVEGHTDYREPTGIDPCVFGDNWELSSRRAAAIVRILAAHGGLDPRGLSAVGRSKFHSVTGISEDMPDVNALTERDRRIELVLQYSEADIRNTLDLAGASE